MRTRTLLAVTAVAGLIATAAAAQNTFINIGTAGLGGGFYPAGGAICNMVNKTRGEYGHSLRCTVEASAGSIANIRAVAAGDMAFALANPEWQFAAYNGKLAFEGEAVESLRHLMSIHSDAWHMVVRADSGIESFEDLRGKIVNTGNVGSGTEATLYLLLEEYGIDPATDFAQDSKLTSREQAQALCDGRIDAFLFSSGLPSPSVTEAISVCDAKLLNWRDEGIAAFMEKYPYFTPFTIPGGTYEGYPDPIETWGIRSTVVTTSDMADETAYIIVKSVFENFDEFVAQTPVFSGLAREDAALAGTAPTHEGALRYYREVGLAE